MCHEIDMNMMLLLFRMLDYTLNMPYIILSNATNVMMLRSVSSVIALIKKTCAAVHQDMMNLSKQRYDDPMNQLLITLNSFALVFTPRT